MHQPLRVLIRFAAAAAFAVTFVFTSGVAAEPDPELPDLPASQWEELHQGELYVDVQRDGELNSGTVVGIIQAPISEVTPLIARCWEYADWRDNIRETNFESQADQNNIVCSGTARVPFPGRDRHGHFDVHNQSTDVEGTRSFVSTFQYIDDSGNLEDMYGYWVVHPYGPNNEHTVVKHELNVDIGSWLPGALIRWATGRVLPNTITGIRHQVDDSLPEPLYWSEYDYE